MMDLGILDCEDNGATHLYKEGEGKEEGSWQVWELNIYDNPNLPEELVYPVANIDKFLKGTPYMTGGILSLNHNPVNLLDFAAIPGKSVTVYHGTSEDATIEDGGILLDGFDKSRQKPGWFGRGFYFTPDIKKALDYACCKKGEFNQIVICEIKLGNCHRFSKGLPDPHQDLAGSHYGNNSVIGELSERGREIVVYDPERILILGSVSITLS
jgi:hypothetical protein